jgi:serine/threonine protein phosphatase PrpC
MFALDRCAIYLRYVLDHAYCYLYSVSHRMSAHDIYNLRIWIIYSSLIQFLLIVSPVLYFIYAVSSLILFHLMMRVEEQFDIPVSSVMHNIKVRRSNNTNTYHTILGEWAGMRPYMEDRTLVLDSLNIYGIFDGHSGSDMSEFMVNNFEEYYEHTKYSKLCRLSDTIERLEYGARINKVRGGSTCVVVQILRDIVLCSSVGDSEAHIFMSDSTIVPLTSAHTFGRFDEYYAYCTKHRSSKKHPLHVSNTIRTCTGLMPTRTIGDFRHKSRDIALISEPETRGIYIGSKQWEVIIIGSDGIFDRLSPRRIIDEMYRARIMTDNECGYTYDLSDYNIYALMQRLGQITTSYPSSYDKVRDIYGGDNCSICILINQNRVG